MTIETLTYEERASLKGLALERGAEIARLREVIKAAEQKLAEAERLRDAHYAAHRPR